jgi:hypothetical protein
LRALIFGLRDVRAATEYFVDVASFLEINMNVGNRRPCAPRLIGVPTGLTRVFLAVYGDGSADARLGSRLALVSPDVGGDEGRGHEDTVVHRRAAAGCDDGRHGHRPGG